MKNRILVYFFSLSIIGGLALDSQGQTTQPAPAVGLTAKQSRVEVFPFTAVNSTGQQDWIGRGIQESLQTEVSRTGATLLLPTEAPAGPADPIATARQNHADLAVTGSFQIQGDDIRVTGHLQDVTNNTALGSFAATGPQKNLFTLEDALGEQLRRLLPASSATAQVAPTVLPQAQSSGPTIVYEQAPPVSYPAPSVNNYYDTTPAYGYAYPDFYDAYPFGFYGGIGIYSGGYYGRGFRDYGHAFGGRNGYAGGHSFGTSPGFAAGRGGFSAGRGGFSGGRGGFSGGHGFGGHR